VDLLSARQNQEPRKSKTIWVYDRRPWGDFCFSVEGKIKNQFSSNWFIRAEDGFEPATFSLARIIQTLTREYVVPSNLDLLPSTNSMMKNVKKNVVFRDILKYPRAWLESLTLGCVSSVTLCLFGSQEPNELGFNMHIIKHHP
jgi:hypothetical protein